MATKEGAEQACVNKHPVIDGRQANVDLAFRGAKPKPIRGKDMKIQYQTAVSYLSVLSTRTYDLTFIGQVSLMCVRFYSPAPMKGSPSSPGYGYKQNGIVRLVLTPNLAITIIK